MTTNFGNTIASIPVANTPTLVINSNVTLTGAAYGKSYKVTGAYVVTLPTLISGSSGMNIGFMNDSTSSVTLNCQGSDYVRVMGVSVATITLVPGDSMVLQNTGGTFCLADSNPTKASLSSPTFTGTPLAPTAAANTNTTQIATTAFVIGQASGLTPSADAAVASAGASNTFARGDHVHPPTDALIVNYTPAGTGATTSTVQKKFRGLPINATVDYGLVSGGTALLNAANNSIAIQKAIDYCGLARIPLYIPAGTYYIANCLNLSSTLSGLEHEGMSICGDGKSSTILQFSASTGAMIETQGSDAVSLRDFACYGNTAVGLFAGRGTTRIWGGNHFYQNLIISVAPDLTKNSGVGSIAYLCREAEESRSVSCEYWADLPYFNGPPTSSNVSQFDINCVKQADITFSFTPQYTPVVSTSVSNTVFPFWNCRFVSQNYGRPCAVIRSASDVDFGNSFFQKNNAGFANPFVLDTTSVFRLFANGQQEFNPTTPAVGGGSLIINGQLDGSVISVTTGQSTASTGANKVPVIFVATGAAYGILDNILTFRLNTELNQIPIGINTTGSLSGMFGWNNTITFQGSSGVSFLPPNLMGVLNNTVINFSGSNSNPNSNYKVTLIDSCRQAYEINHTFTTGSSVQSDTIATLALSGNNSGGLAIKFSGVLESGYVYNENRSCMAYGEFNIVAARDIAVSNLAISTSNPTWNIVAQYPTGLSMTSPTVAGVATTPSLLSITVQKNTSGTESAGATCRLVGRMEVLNTLWNNNQIPLLSFF